MKDVCCFDLSRRLKNLGVQQKSLCYWSPADARARMLIYLIRNNYANGSVAL